MSRTRHKKGDYSLANTTVIKAEDGLIVYDTGDNNEEVEHIREAIEKISDKPIKVIIYSHSHYALGARKRSTQMQWN